jgi:hypothetical protein
MKNRNISRLLLLGFAPFLLFACQAKVGGNSTSASDTASATIGSSSSTNTATSGSGTPPAPAAVEVGVRNFDQVNSTMESVTGVMGNKNVLARFAILKGQLPSTNDISAFSFSGQGAVTVLAAEYCTALIQNSGNAYATQLAAAIGTFNLKAVPTVAFTTATSAALAQSLILQFWGAGYANNTNAAAAEQSVEQLLTELTTGLPNTATTTQNAVIGACTSVLASSPTTVF